MVAAAGLWGEPFRPDGGDAFVAPLAAVPPPVPGVAAVDVVVETEVKFALPLQQAQDEAVTPPVEEAAPSSDSFGHDDARPRDKVSERERKMNCWHEDS
jgi:transcription factor TGA